MLSPLMIPNKSGFPGWNPLSRDRGHGQRIEGGPPSRSGLWYNPRNFTCTIVVVQWGNNVSGRFQPSNPAFRSTRKVDSLRDLDRAAANRRSTADSPAAGGRIAH